MNTYLPSWKKVLRKILIFQQCLLVKNLSKNLTNPPSKLSLQSSTLLMSKRSKQVSIQHEMWLLLRLIEKMMRRSKTLNRDSQESCSKMFKNQRSSFSNQNKSVLRILTVRKKLLFNQSTELISRLQSHHPYLQTDLSLHSPFHPNLMRRKVKKKPTRSLLRKNKKSFWSQPFHDQAVRSHETLCFITLSLINTSLLLMFHHLLIRLLSLTINCLNDCRWRIMSTINHHILSLNLGRSIIEPSQEEYRDE